MIERFYHWDLRLTLVSHVGLTVANIAMSVDFTGTSDRSTIDLWNPNPWNSHKFLVNRTD